MQAYSLRPGVHYCRTDGVTTFLDVDADRYFGLPASCERAFAHLVANGAVSRAQVCELAPLLAAKLLLPMDNSASFPLPVSIPAARLSALDLISERNSLWQFLMAWCCQAQAKRELGRRTLMQTLARLRAKKATAGPSQTAPSDAILGAFLSTSAVTPSRDHCLRRSVAMIDFLGRHDCHPLFVIGVKPQPFGAHAWVQFDDMILNDEVEHVARFTPILAI